MERILILAGDVSKGYADFILLNGTGEYLSSTFRLYDSSAGRIKLMNKVLNWRKEYDFNRMLLVVESTGGYEDNWLNFTKRAEFKNQLEGYRLNPKITHHEYRIQNRRSIDDGVSALTIGLHVCKNLKDFQLSVSVQDEDIDLKSARTLHAHIQQLEKACTAQKNSLEKLLYSYLPFMLQANRSRWPGYFLSILKRYSSFASIQKAAKQGFKSVKRVPKKWLEGLLECLSNDLDICPTPLLIQLTIRDKAEEIIRLEEKIDTLKRQLIDHFCELNKDVSILTSLPGMGFYTAIILLLHIESISRFSNAAKLASYFGVIPQVKKSGDNTGGQTRMSKQGNGRVRAELYHLAFRCLSTNPYLRSIYARNRQKGMSHDAALGILMHKIVRIVYGMLKHQRRYEPAIDQMNQIDSRFKVKEENENFLPVLKVEVATAPVSRRHLNKLKKSYETQAASMADNTSSS